MGLSKEYRELEFVVAVNKDNPEVELMDLLAQVMDSYGVNKKPLDENAQQLIDYSLISMWFERKYR